MRTAGQWVERRVCGQAPALRLLCLPHAGGAAALFRGWQAMLPASIEVCPLLLPGRESRLLEPAPTRMSELVASLWPAVAELSDVPCVLFGHSMGALVAYELARRWQAAGAPPLRHLMVSAMTAPQLRRGGALHRADDESIVAWLRAHAVTPTEILASPSLRSLFLPTVRADLTLVETYQYLTGPRLTCPVTVYVGAADPLVDAVGCVGWSALTAGPWRLRRFGGSHFYLTERRSQVLADIAATLARVA